MISRILINIYDFSCLHILVDIRNRLHEIKDKKKITAEKKSKQRKHKMKLNQTTNATNLYVPIVKNQLERQHVYEETNKLLVHASKRVVVDGSMIRIGCASDLD